MPWTPSPSSLTRAVTVPVCVARSTVRRRFLFGFGDGGFGTADAESRRAQALLGRLEVSLGTAEAHFGLLEIGLAQYAFGMKVLVFACTRALRRQRQLVTGPNAPPKWPRWRGRCPRRPWAWLQAAFKDVGVDPCQQISSGHYITFTDRQLDELATDFCRNLDLDFGLDAAGGDDGFYDAVSGHRIGFYARRFRPTAKHGGKDQKEQDAASKDGVKAFPFHLEDVEAQSAACIKVEDGDAEDQVITCAQGSQPRRIVSVARLGILDLSRGPLLEPQCGVVEGEFGSRL